MIVSQARIEANRKNAQLSTGPKTAEGKARSRANALKHGLCSSVVVPESLELVQERSQQFFDRIKPDNRVDVWMVEQAALCSIRIDRCQRIERRVRDKIALRAELGWDDDRRFEVEVIARSLSKDPASTVAALRRTIHGCEWMIARWALLAHAGETQPEGWTEDQNKLAFDLLATPHGFRDGKKPGVTLNDSGQIDQDFDHPANVARRQITLLKEKRDAVADLDEAERALATNDLTNEGDPELRRLRRYETTLHTRMRWSLRQVENPQSKRWPDPALRPKWVMEPEPVPKPEPPHPDDVAAAAWSPVHLHPPFDLEPDEFPPMGEKANIPEIVMNRREKRFRKAEASRQKRREKSQKLRA